MARLTAEIVNGQRVVEVETQEEFLHYLNLGPVRAPREIRESLGFTDALPPEKWEEELKGEREWEELFKKSGPRRIGWTNHRWTPPVPSLSRTEPPRPLW